MPQGGIDEGEEPRGAALRELKEETGTDKAEIIGEMENWLTYDLPPHLVGIAFHGKYRGQRQKWFALRFLGRDDDIDLYSHEPGIRGMEMGGDGGAPPTDRAVQARYLRRRHRGLSRPGQASMNARKPPMVMIHGAFAAPFVWDGFAAKFRAAGYKVHTPCLRHHAEGGPPAGLAQTSLTDYADDLKSLLHDLVAPPVLVGHAMGALLAQMLAARCDLRGGPFCLRHRRPGVCRPAPCSRSQAPRPCC